MTGQPARAVDDFVELRSGRKHFDAERLQPLGRPRRDDAAGKDRQVGTGRAQLADDALRHFDVTADVQSHEIDVFIDRCAHDLRAGAHAAQDHLEATVPQRARDDGDAAPVTVEGRLGEQDAPRPASRRRGGVCG